MNILLVTVDSLRVDRTSLLNHDRDTTPFLADLAADGFDFKHAYANGFNTASSFPSVHTSTHQSYYEGVGIPPTGVPTLAEFLSDEGLATHAIHTNELLSREYNYDRGFDSYHDSRTRETMDTNGSWRTRARDLIGDGFAFELVKRAHFLSTEYLGVKIFDTADAVSEFSDEILSLVKDSDGDWFVWAHYMNPHHPYEPPQPDQEALGLDPVPRREATKLSRKMRLHPEDVTPDEREILRGLYDASVLSWDREVRSLHERLNGRGDLENTLIVVTADHGEFLGEDGQYGHPPCLRQPLLRVPLVFAGDPVKRGQSEAQVGLLDLAPTLATLVGADPPQSWQGRALFEADGTAHPLEETPQFCEVQANDRPQVAAVNYDRKLVHKIATDEWQASRLPDENRLTERETEEEFIDLKTAIEDHEAAAVENREHAASVGEEQLREDLAALGYIDE